MLEKQFVPPEPSLDLQELGFNEPCFGYYLNGKLNIFYSTSVNYRINSKTKNVFNTDVFTAPTFSQAFRWFREKYKIDSNIESLGINKRFYSIYVAFEDNKEIKGDGNLYETYEEAELECLKKLIEIVKSKKE
jgi:hypothetical protein